MAYPRVPQLVRYDTVPSIWALRYVLVFNSHSHQKKMQVQSSTQRARSWSAVLCWTIGPLDKSCVLFTCLLCWPIDGHAYTTYTLYTLPACTSVPLNTSHTGAGPYRDLYPLLTVNCWLSVSQVESSTGSSSSKLRKIQSKTCVEHWKLKVTRSSASRGKEQ